MRGDWECRTMNGGGAGGPEFVPKNGAATLIRECDNVDRGDKRQTWGQVMTSRGSCPHALAFIHIHRDEVQIPFVQLNLKNFEDMYIISFQLWITSITDIFFIKWKMNSVKRENNGLCFLFWQGYITTHAGSPQLRCSSNVFLLQVTDSFFHCAETWLSPSVADCMEINLNASFHLILRQGLGLSRLRGH